MDADSDTRNTNASDGYRDWRCGSKASDFNSGIRAKQRHAAHNFANCQDDASGSTRKTTLIAGIRVRLIIEVPGELYLAKTNSKVEREVARIICTRRIRGAE